MMIRNFITVFGIFLAFNSLAQPNDLCANATALTPDGTCVASTNVGAADNLAGEIGCASAGGPNNHPEVWFSVNVTETALDIDVTGGTLNSGNIEILIYSGTCASLTAIADGCGAAPGTVTATATGLTPGTYLVSVSGSGSSTGTFDICPTEYTPPANDNCTGAISVTPDGSCQTGTTVFANDSWTGDVGCATTGAADEHLDVWYSFVATGGIFDITATDISIGGDLEIVLAEPGANPCVDAFTILNTFCGTSPVTGTYGGLTPGNTYYYTVSSPNNQSGNFETCVTTSSLSNDDCANATPITVGTNGICNLETGTTTGSSASAGAPAPSCGSYLGGDVWYSITVPASGEVTFTVNPPGGGTTMGDADLAIYSGVCGSLTEIECDDFDGTGLWPQIQATGLTPGTTVYVRVWEYGNNQPGDFDICISEPPVTLNNQDCNTAIPICGGTTFAGASNGPGSVTDLTASNDDCLAGENESSWVYFEVSSPGDIEFTISPSNGTDDYDFGLWVYPGGAGVTCPPANGTIDRCSWAAGSGLGGSFDTGLGQGATDTSEGATGDNWVAPVIGLNVGDVLYLIVDNFSSTTSPYTLDFAGSTAGLDCTILPTEMLSFYVKTLNNEKNQLFWHTLSEQNNDFFTLETSTDGINWRELTTVDGAGNSNERVDYLYIHEDIDQTINYYRIHQTDYDGTTSDYRIVSIDNTFTDGIVLYTTNLLGQKVDATYKGIVIDVHSNGKTVKRMQR